MSDYQCEVDNCKNRASATLVIQDWTADDYHDYEPRTISVCDDCLFGALEWTLDEGAFFCKPVKGCNHKPESRNPYETLYVQAIDPKYEYCRACGDARKVAA